MNHGDGDNERLLELFQIFEFTGKLRKEKRGFFAPNTAVSTILGTSFFSGLNCSTNYEGILYGDSQHFEVIN